MEMMRFMVHSFLLFKFGQCKGFCFSRCIDIPYHFLKLHLNFGGQNIVAEKFQKRLKCICWSLFTTFNYQSQGSLFPQIYYSKLLKKNVVQQVIRTK